MSAGKAVQRAAGHDHFQPVQPVVAAVESRAPFSRRLRTRDIAAAGHSVGMRGDIAARLVRRWAFVRAVIPLFLQVAGQPHFNECRQAGMNTGLSSTRSLKTPDVADFLPLLELAQACTKHRCLSGLEYFSLSLRCRKGARLFTFG